MKVPSLDNNFLWHFSIDQMLSQDRQMIVDGFRHQNFWIWTTFGWFMGVLMKIISKTTLKAEKEQISSFSTKIVITQSKMVQIQKFWCLKPSTIIYLSRENILSIKKCHRKLLTREGTFKTFKIIPQFYIKNAKKWTNSKRSHSQKFCHSVGA